MRCGQSHGLAWLPFLCIITLPGAGAGACSALLFSFFLSSCASRSRTLSSVASSDPRSLPSRRPEPTVMSRWHAIPTSYIRCHRMHSTAQQGLAAENPAVVVPKR
jgi:hypothetical protein